MDYIDKFKKEKWGTKFDIFFFDIFDTIVTRNVDPEYVKKIWCSHIVNIKKILITSENLYIMRNRIEIELCNQSTKSGFDAEFKYEKMIEKLYLELKLVYSYAEDYKKFLKSCEELEIEIESNSQEIDKDLINFISFLKVNKKKVYCISDMYLSKDMINKIFERHEIRNLMDDLYISSENLLSKRSGKLYDFVIRELNINKKKIIMFGDNCFSDNEIPKEKGIEAYLINREEQRLKYKKFTENNTELKLFKNFDLLIQKEKKLPFVNTIFSLYYFIEKLYFALINCDAKDVVFFSREGEYLKKLFDDYQSTIFGPKIKTHYAIVSRKSTYVPSLSTLNDETFLGLLTQYSLISINDFLKSLSFSNQNIKEIKSTFNNNIVFDKQISNFSSSSELKNLKKNRKFIEIYNKKRKEQNLAFRSYFDSLGLIDEKNVYVVDIGWKGSIQNNIMRILKKSKIFGYYFGMNTFVKNEEKEGLVFSNVPETTNNFNLYNENRSLYEIILGASHGSADSYEYDFEKRQFFAKTFQKNEEKELYLNKILPIQKEMMLYFVLIKELMQNKFYNQKLFEKKINRAHYAMLFKPDERHIQFFNEIYHYENFGVFSFTKFLGKTHYKNKIREYAKYLFKNKVYISDHYWTQLKIYNNNLKMLYKLYSLQRYIEFKLKNVI